MTTATVTRAALTVAVLLSIGACGGTGDVPTASASAAPALVDMDAVVDQESIFNLDLALVDHASQHLQLADLRGHTLLAAMVYTSCTSVCLMVTEQMKAIEGQLAGVDDDVRYVLFSLDPGRDTPDAMREFLRSHKLDESRWRLMAASEDGVRDLAAVLGVKYQSEENGDIAHSAMIFVIDQHGVVRHRQVGVDKDSRQLVAAVTSTQH